MGTHGDFRTPKRRPPAPSPPSASGSNQYEKSEVKITEKVYKVKEEKPSRSRRSAVPRSETEHGGESSSQARKFQEDTEAKAAEFRKAQIREVKAKESRDAIEAELLGARAQEAEARRLRKIIEDKLQKAEADEIEAQKLRNVKEFEFRKAQAREHEAEKAQQKMRGRNRDRDGDRTRPVSRGRSGPDSVRSSDHSGPEKGAMVVHGGGSESSDGEDCESVDSYNGPEFLEEITKGNGPEGKSYKSDITDKHNDDHDHRDDHRTERPRKAKDARSRAPPMYAPQYQTVYPPEPDYNARKGMRRPTVSDGTSRVHQSSTTRTYRVHNVQPPQYYNSPYSYGNGYPPTY